MMTDNARGALLIVIAMALFVFNDTCMKLLLVEVPLFQALLVRGVLMTAIMGLLAWRAGALALHHLSGMAPRDRALIGARCLADTASTWFFLQALAHMPLANMTAIFQSLPLIVTLGAALFLGEKVGWRRLVAIVIGFCGVLLIVRPDAEGFDIFALYALASVVLVSARELFTRRMSKSVPSMLITLANVLAVTLFGASGVVVTGLEPVSTPMLGLLALAALFNVSGYLLTVMAVRIGDLSFVTPFRYTGLVSALVLGFVVFGDWPDAVTALGAALIVGTGLFTFYRERINARARARAPLNR